MIGDIVGKLLERAPTLADGRLLAMDGPAGSGKTTLASLIEADLTRRGHTAGTVHMDDLYEDWTGLNPSLEPRLLDQILRPLSTGRPARWQQYDWYAHRFDSWHDLPPTDVLLMEGCGSGARAYEPYVGLLVWVEADRDTRINRGLTRDGVGVRDHWMAWMDLEEEHFAANDTRRRADIILRNE